MRIGSRERLSWWTVESKLSEEGSEDTREQRLFPLLKVCPFRFHEALSHASFHLILTTTLEGKYFYFNYADKRNRYREINLLAWSHHDRAITHSESFYCTPPPPPTGYQEQNSYENGSFYGERSSIQVIYILIWNQKLTLILLFHSLTSEMAQREKRKSQSHKFG